jgi:hypothetical protein
MVMSILPGSIKDTIAQVTSRIELGNLEPYGIKKPEWKIFNDLRIPMIDVGFIDFLKQGSIKIRPNINGFTENGVTYEDNHEPENFDAVISATGFRTGLGNILKVDGVFDDKGYLTIECGEPTPHKGLWFVGYDNSPAGVLVTTRIQARKIGKYLAAERGIKV